jgi:hypothetical protein
LFRNVYPSCNSAQNGGKRVLSLVWNAIIPGKLETAICELYVFLSAEPVETCPKEVNMNVEQNFEKED